MLKNKFQTLTLVGGLTAGMSACLLLLQYVGYELSFDRFHTKRERIYRVVNERFQNGKSIQKGTITYPTIVMQKWLADFAYHIDLQWWMFTGAGAAAIAIAFLTVGFQSVKAALTNPVKSLRSE